MMTLFPSLANCRTPTASPSSVPEPKPWYTTSKITSRFFSYKGGGRAPVEVEMGVAISNPLTLPFQQSSTPCTIWTASPTPCPWGRTQSGCAQNSETAPPSLLPSPTKQIRKNTWLQHGRRMKRREHCCVHTHCVSLHAIPNSAWFMS